MPTGTNLKRKSFFVDQRRLREAMKVLGVRTEAEVIRLSIDRVLEMERFWRFMDRTRSALPPGSVDDAVARHVPEVRRSPGEAHRGRRRRGT
jgi:hypothetical protein